MSVSESFRIGQANLTIHHDPRGELSLIFRFAPPPPPPHIDPPPPDADDDLYSAWSAAF